MDRYAELCSMLERELMKVSSRGEISNNSLDMIYKITIVESIAIEVIAMIIVETIAVEKCMVRGRITLKGTRVIH